MFKVISHFTIGTPYEDEAGEFMISADKLGVDYFLFPRRDLHDWALNCQQKTLCILMAMVKFKCDIVYTDIDARFQKYPELFNNIYDDFAYHELNTTKELLSGTLFFKNTQNSLALLMLWDQINNTNVGKTFDQVTLVEALKRSNISTSILPEEYCRIFDNPHQTCSQKDTVILHIQASRRYKGVINDRHSNPND